MVRRKWLLVFVGGVCAAALACLALKRPAPRPPEPIFAGKTITQWLTSKDYQTNQAAVKLAVFALREKSVPALSRMLHSGAQWQRVYVAHAPLWLYRKLPIGGYQFDYKDRAMWALEMLRWDGRQATPDLLAIAQDTTEHLNQRRHAIGTLYDIEAQPSVVLPVMVKLTNDPVIGKVAADYLRMVRSVAEHSREHAWHPTAKSDSQSTEAAQPKFQPSSSFLENTSVWGPEKPPRTSLKLDTNVTLIPLAHYHPLATNCLRHDMRTATNR
jgi:hypothetical protein